jgi:hypothetical protein
MSELHLGFFPQFKGTDTVLLESTARGIAHLSLRLNQFVASSEALLPIHNLATVSRRHPVQLFASRSEHHEVEGFQLSCSATQFSTMQGKLTALVSAASGHQYFNLLSSPVQLLVAVGEYGPSWWQAHG